MLLNVSVVSFSLIVVLLVLFWSCCCSFNLLCRGFNLFLVIFLSLYGGPVVLLLYSSSFWLLICFYLCLFCGCFSSLWGFNQFSIQTYEGTLGAAAGLPRPFGPPVLSLGLVPDTSTLRCCCQIQRLIPVTQIRHTSSSLAADGPLLSGRFLANRIHRKQVKPKHFPPLLH